MSQSWSVVQTGAMQSATGWKGHRANRCRRKVNSTYATMPPAFAIIPAPWGGVGSAIFSGTQRWMFVGPPSKNPLLGTRPRSRYACRRASHPAETADRTTATIMPGNSRRPRTLLRRAVKGLRSIPQTRALPLPYLVTFDLLLCGSAVPRGLKAALSRPRRTGASGRQDSGLCTLAPVRASAKVDCLSASLVPSSRLLISSSSLANAWRAPSSTIERPTELPTLP